MSIAFALNFVQRYKKKLTYTNICQSFSFISSFCYDYTTIFGIFWYFLKLIEMNIFDIRIYYEEAIVSHTYGLAIQNKDLG